MRYKFLLSAAAIVPVTSGFAGVALAHATGIALVALIPFMLSAMIAHIPPIRRFRESRGTALDIAIASRMGFPLGEYEDRKVQARLGYSVFRGWTAEEIKALLVSLRPWAAKAADRWA